MRVKNWSKFQHYKRRNPPWIRLYRCLLDDRQWHNLDPVAAKALISIWLIASERDGELPPVADLAFRLRMTEKQVSSVLSSLSHWIEHDASATLADCGHVATPETETDNSETDKAGASAPELSEEEFEEFKKNYPRRKSSIFWKPARKVWDAAIKRGADPPRIIAAIKAGVGFDPENVGTNYIPMPEKWLRDERWTAHEHQPAPHLVVNNDGYAAFGSPEMEAWEAHERATGKSYPRDKRGGWTFPTRWPPNEPKVVNSA